MCILCLCLLSCSLNTHFWNVWISTRHPDVASASTYAHRDGSIDAERFAESYGTRGVRWPQILEHLMHHGILRIPINTCSSSGTRVWYIYIYIYVNSFQTPLEQYCITVARVLGTTQHWASNFQCSALSISSMRKHSSHVACPSNNRTVNWAPPT